MIKWYKMCEVLPDNGQVILQCIVNHPDYPNDYASIGGTKFTWGGNMTKEEMLKSWHESGYVCDRTYWCDYNDIEWPKGS